MKEYNKPRQSNNLQPELYGDDPSPQLGFLRGVFLANHMESNDDLTKTTKRQNSENTYQRKLTIRKKGPNNQQYNIKHAKIHD